MTSVMVFILFSTLSSSPSILSFLLVLISLWVSMKIFMEHSVLFPPMGITISFSTGMMVLFCYCSSLINFEKKNSSKQQYSIFMVLFLMTSNTEKMAENTMESYSTMDYQLQFLMLAMILVIISMISINKSMFNIKTPSMSIY